MNSQLKRAVGYARKSTEDQAQSIGLQQQSIERGAAEYGFAVQQWFKDEGVSGTIPMNERPAGRSLFEFLPSHPEIEAVFFDDITRMERSNDLHCYSHRLYEFHTKYKVVVFFVSDKQRSDSPNISDFLVCVIKGMESSEYSRKLSFKTARGQIAVVEKGYLSGRQAPYGMDRLLIDVDGTQLSRWVVLPDGSLQKFNLDGTQALDRPIPPVVKARHQANGHGGQELIEIRVTESLPKSRNQRVTLTPSFDPVKTSAVKWLFENFSSGALGLAALAADLNRKGIPPPCTNGGPRRRHARPGQAAFWRSSTVRYILTNPAYYGAILFNRRCLSKFWRIQREEKGWRQLEQCVVKKTAMAHNLEQDWVREIRSEAALISKDLFDKAQRQLLHRSRKDLPRKRRAFHLLSGIVRCQCGSRMNGWVATKTKQYKNGTRQTFAYRRYNCSTSHASGGSYCGYHSINAEALETFTLEKLRGFLREIARPEKIAAQALAQSRKGQCYGEVEEEQDTTTELAQIERNLAGLPPLDQVAPALRAAFETQRTEWLRRKQELRQMPRGQVRTNTLNEKAFRAEALNLLDEIEGLNLCDNAQRLRELVEACIDHITLYFEPVQAGKRRLYRLLRGEMAFYRHPAKWSLRGNRGGGI